MGVIATLTIRAAAGPWPVNIGLGQVEPLNARAVAHAAAALQHEPAPLLAVGGEDPPRHALGPVAGRVCPVEPSIALDGLPREGCLRTTRSSPRW